MRRRDLLKGLLSVPVVGAIPASNVSPQADLDNEISDDEDFRCVYHGADTYLVLSDMLWTNMVMESQIGGEPRLTEREQVLSQALCIRLVRRLLLAQETSFDSSTFYPDQPKNLLSGLQIGVIDYKSGKLWVANRAAPTALAFEKHAQTRMPNPTWRPTRARFSQEACDDLRAFHCIDAETVFLEAAAEQIALEVECEIRKDYAEGKHIETYVFQLPPTIQADSRDPLRIRRAKIYADIDNT